MTAQTTLNYVPDDSEQKSANEPASAATTGTDLIVIDPKSTELITSFSQEKGLDPVIEKIKKRVKTEHMDVTTEDGRARIGSIARQIGSAKMELKRMGQTLTEDWRTKTKAVTAETSRMEKELDALRDEVLAPRTEFENREKARVEAHESNLIFIAVDLVNFNPDASLEEIKEKMDILNSKFLGMDWQEFSNRADMAITQTTKFLKSSYDRRSKEISDAAELARHRKEQAEREQKERDDKIAADAAAKAKAEAEEKARLEQEERDRIAAAALKAEQDRLAAAEKKAADDAAAAAKALKDAEELAEKQRLEREAEVKKEQDAAAERERLAKERADKAEQDRKATHTQAMFQMAEMIKVPPDAAATVIQSRMDTLKVIYQRDWQEFASNAEEIFTVGSKNLTILHGERVRAEAERKRIADKAALDKVLSDALAEAAAKQKIIDDATAKRNADTAHKAKINNEALAALANVIGAETSQLSTEYAKSIVIAIAEGKIPHVTITY